MHVWLDVSRFHALLCPRYFFIRLILESGDIVGDVVIPTVALSFVGSRAGASASIAVSSKPSPSLSFSPRFGDCISSDASALGSETADGRSEDDFLENNFFAVRRLSDGQKPELVKPEASLLAEGKCEWLLLFM